MAGGAYVRGGDEAPAVSGVAVSDEGVEVDADVIDECAVALGVIVAN